MCQKVVLRFADGRGSVEDDARKGRPVTVKTSKLIADVERLVTEDRRITVRDIEESFDIGYGTAQEILTKDLQGH